MKIYTYLFAIIFCIFLFSCHNNPNSVSATVNNAQDVDTTSAKIGTSWIVDTNSSTIEWTGSKLVGGSHTGTIKLQKSNLLVDSSMKIIGGRFVLNMQSIQPIDGDSAGNAKLKEHLSSKDFFSADSFPTSTFEITSIKPFTDTSANASKITHTIMGNLTIKGIAKNISFPAQISDSSKLIEVNAVFNIDRTQWGINYGSQGSIKDRIINNDINFRLRIVAHL